MKRHIGLLWLLFLVSLSTGCKKNQLSSTKELLTFALEATYNNDQLNEDVIGLITGSTITLNIPKGTNLTQLIATFTHSGESVFVIGVEQQSTVTANDFSKEITYSVQASDGSQVTYSIQVEEIQSSLPHLYITTNDNVPITSKDNYVEAKITILGGGLYENYEGTTGIRGRGNSTWELPKKPYRLKLDSKSPLLGLPEARDWVLLANYLDETLMLNAVAMKIGKLLDIPYTNTIIPVNVTLNDEFLGSYMFTEQVQVHENRVNIEDGGVLLELDSGFDEDWKFYSVGYSLPVNVKYPDITAQSELDLIQADFQKMENLIIAETFPNNDYLNLIDADALVNYLIVYNLTANGEINYPKSTFMYKPEGGKYTMGPIWDFDWAFSFDGIATHFNNHTNPLFITDTHGANFFERFLLDPDIAALYKEKWEAFRTEKLSAVLDYIVEYADLIAVSKRNDYEVWQYGSDDFSGDVQKLREWIQARASYIDASLPSTPAVL